MRIVLSQTFPLGRFHATPWAANPFDDPHGELTGPALGGWRGQSPLAGINGQERRIINPTKPSLKGCWERFAKAAFPFIFLCIRPKVCHFVSINRLNLRLIHQNIKHSMPILFSQKMVSLMTFGISWK